MTHYTETNLAGDGWSNPVERKAFAAFMRRVNAVVSARVGLCAEDFADACWADLYQDLGADVTDDDIIETLAEADDLFAAMMDCAD